MHCWLRRDPSYLANINYQPLVIFRESTHHVPGHQQSSRCGCCWWPVAQGCTPAQTSGNFLPCLTSMVPCYTRPCNRHFSYFLSRNVMASISQLSKWTMHSHKSSRTRRSVPLEWGQHHVPDILQGSSWRASSVGACVGRALLSWLASTEASDSCRRLCPVNPAQHKFCL